MIQKEITFFGQKAKVACDAECEKAWGINSRPKIQLSEKPDDYCFLSDDELEIAPKDPGTYEGGYEKPTTKDERLNRWCVRQCERCFVSKPGEADKEITKGDLPNFNKRRGNN